MRAFYLNILLAVFGVSASASTGDFSYLYTAETHAKGDYEYEQYNTLRSGKASGTYNAADIAFVLEAGLTERLQIATYLRTTYVNIKDVPGYSNINQYDLNGLAVEFVYGLYNAYRDSFGMAVYVEPFVEVRSGKDGQPANKRGIDFRLLLQKNFFDDDMITALNFQLEPEWKRTASGNKKALEAGVNFGASYRVGPRIFAGVEVVSNLEYDDMKLDHQEYYAWSAGPMMSYGSEKYWWTLTALPQVAAWPKTNGELNLDEKEKFQLRFKFGIPMGESSH